MGGQLCRADHRSSRDVTAGPLVSSPEHRRGDHEYQFDQKRLAGSVAERVFVTPRYVVRRGRRGHCTAGLIGLVASITARLTREIAIRIAVGARPTHVSRSSLEKPLPRRVSASCSDSSRHDSIDHVARFSYDVALNTWLDGRSRRACDVS